MTIGIYKQLGGPVDVVYGWDEIAIVTDGPVEATIDGKTTVCNAGDSIITPKGTAVTLNAPVSTAGIVITLPHLAEALKESPLEGAID
jgi:ethanolamine utilization protein EutQ (cupin superfamily)